VAISYNKLWKLMIDHKMNKTQLRKEAGLSTNVIAKLSKDDSVSMDTLLRICNVLHCDIGDIVEVVEEDSQSRVIEYVGDDKHNHLKVAENVNGDYESKPNGSLKKEIL
jgi:DNA-binding Xre family transcriptional regulator